MDQQSASINDKPEFPKTYLWTVVAWAVAAVIIDQCSKLLVRRSLEFGEPHAVIDGWLYFTRAQNFGAAWSVLSGQRIVLVLVTLAVIGLLVGAAKELASNGIAARIGLGLVLGGAFGNLIDRLVFGHVTDFINMGSPWHWLATFPVFNIADSCLTVGAILLALSFFLVKNSS